MITSMKALSDYMDGLVNKVTQLRKVVDVGVYGSDHDKYHTSPMLEWDVPSLSNAIIPTISVTIKGILKADRSNLRSIQDILLLVTNDVIKNMLVDTVIPDTEIEILPVDIDENNFTGFSFEVQLQSQMYAC